jgi:hypothetical protein
METATNIRLAWSRGATENTAVVQVLIDNLIERGFATRRPAGGVSRHRRCRSPEELFVLPQILLGPEFHYFCD